MTIWSGMGLLVLVGLTAYGIDAMNSIPSYSVQQTAVAQPSAMLAQSATGASGSASIAQSSASSAGVDEMCIGGETLSINVVAGGLKPTRVCDLPANICKVIITTPEKKGVVKYCCNPKAGKSCSCVDQNTDCNSVFPLTQSPPAVPACKTNSSPKALIESSESQVAGVAGVIAQAADSINCAELNSLEQKYSSAPPAYTPPSVSNPSTPTTPTPQPSGAAPAAPNNPYTPPSVSTPTPAPTTPPSANTGIGNIANGPATPGPSVPSAPQPPVLQPSTVANPVTGGPLAIATPAPVAPLPPAPVAPAPTTGSTFGFSKTTGGILQSPVTSFTSKISSGAFFSGVTSFLGGLLSSLATNSSQESAPSSGGSYTAPAPATPAPQASATVSTPLILVVPAAGGASSAQIIAAENFQKLLTLAKPGLPQTSAQISLPPSSAISGGGIAANAPALGGASDIMSAYQIGSATPDTSTSFDQTQQGFSSGGFQSALDLSWATPTAVVVGTPVDINAAPPASTVFDEFNAGWTANSQTALQEESALAQAQSDYEATQAQIAAWQQLQAAGLCSSDCLTSLASLESETWQQQAQVDALTKSIENGGASPQQGSAPAAFGTAGQSGQPQSIPSAAGNTGVQSALPPAPSAISQYASQADTGPQGFQSSATQTEAGTTSSSGLAGLPAGLSDMWQTLTDWLTPPVSSTGAVQTCSLFNSLFGICGS